MVKRRSEIDRQKRVDLLVEERDRQVELRGGQGG